MRYICFIKVFLAIMLITLPLYTFAQSTDYSSDVSATKDCFCKEKKENLQDTSTCDTYVTDSRSSETLQSTEHKITEQVQKLLANESDLPEITVTTANGVVILSGSASNQAQIDKAANIASSVSCVTEVDTSKFYVH